VKSKHSKRRRATKRAKRRSGPASGEAPSPHARLAEDGVHMLLPGVPSPNLLEELSRHFQEQLRRSPLWKELIQQHGRERAEQILRQCRAQLA
jgi:hypothetical protein